MFPLLNRSCIALYIGVVFSSLTLLWIASACGGGSDQIEPITDAERNTAASQLQAFIEQQRNSNSQDANSQFSWDETAIEGLSDATTEEPTETEPTMPTELELFGSTYSIEKTDLVLYENDIFSIFLPLSVTVSSTLPQSFKAEWETTIDEENHPGILHYNLIGFRIAMYRENYGEELADTIQAEEITYFKTLLKKTYQMTWLDQVEIVDPARLEVQKADAGSYQFGIHTSDDSMDKLFLLYLVQRNEYEYGLVCLLYLTLPKELIDQDEKRIAFQDALYSQAHLLHLFDPSLQDTETPETESPPVPTLDNPDTLTPPSSESEPSVPPPAPDPEMDPIPDLDDFDDFDPDFEGAFD